MFKKLKKKTQENILKSLLNSFKKLKEFLYKIHLKKRYLNVFSFIYKYKQIKNYLIDI